MVNSHIDSVEIVATSQRGVVVFVGTYRRAPGALNEPAFAGTLDEAMDWVASQPWVGTANDATGADQ